MLVSHVLNTSILSNPARQQPPFKHNPQTRARLMTHEHFTLNHVINNNGMDSSTKTDGLLL